MRQIATDITVTTYGTFALFNSRHPKCFEYNLPALRMHSTSHPRRNLRHGDAHDAKRQRHTAEVSATANLRRSTTAIPRAHCTPNIHRCAHPALPQVTRLRPLPKYAKHTFLHSHRPTTPYRVHVLILVLLPGLESSCWDRDNQTPSQPFLDSPCHSLVAPSTTSSTPSSIPASPCC